MNAALFRLLAICAASVAALPAAAATSVTFVKPADYTDIGFYSRDAEQAQYALEQYFKTLGERYLAPNQNLKVEVLDVDLAGRIDYGSRRFYDKRVMRGTADWPRMKFHYVLETDGKVVSDSEADIADMAYLERASSRYTNEAYPYEMRMLEDWFKKTFKEGQAKRQ